VVLVGRDQLARGNDDQLARSGIVVADGSP
jgi:hypothetical protein